EKGGGPGGPANPRAQLANAPGEDRLTARRAGPDRLEQGIFGHELARLRHQAAEHRKRFGGQRGSFGATPQPFVAQIEPERSKDETLRLLHTWSLPWQPDDG